MTYDEIKRLVAKEHKMATSINGLLQETVGKFISTDTEAGGISIDRRYDLSSEECLEILEGQLINPEYVFSRIKEFLAPEETIVFQLQADGDECKITFDHDSRSYKLHIDTEDGSQVIAGTHLSLMMQMARDSFIKPRETSEGFIPGAFMS